MAGSIDRRGARAALLQAPGNPRSEHASARSSCQRGIDRLLCLGAATRDSTTAFGARARHVDTVDALIEAAREAAAAGGTLLVKGSRFMRMERVVGALRADTAGSVAAGAHAGEGIH